jgi:hypothetical protein
MHKHCCAHLQDRLHVPQSFFYRNEEVHIKVPRDASQQVEGTKVHNDCHWENLGGWSCS